jgi:hypothetical protein
MLPLYLAFLFCSNIAAPVFDVDLNGQVKPPPTETPPPPPPMPTNINYTINDATNAVEVQGNVTKVLDDTLPDANMTTIAEIINIIG